MKAVGLAPDAQSTLCDAVGTVHRPDPNARIVCLVPSITELLCSLGLAPQLVGRTGFCIHPHALVADIAKVGGTKDVNIEKIRRLAPSHLIVNIDENEKPTVEELAKYVPHIVVTHPQQPLDNLALFRLLGALFGAEARAEILCADFQSALARLVGRNWSRQRVLYLIWKDPWMTVAPSTYIARMLALVGWQQIPIDSPDRYPAIELGATLSRAELVLLSSEPYRFTESHRAELAQQPGAGQVVCVDGEMLSWYGSRAIGALAYLGVLAESLNPHST